MVVMDFRQVIMYLAAEAGVQEAPVEMGLITISLTTIIRAAEAPVFSYGENIMEQEATGIWVG